VVGPSFSSAEVVDVIEAVLQVYKERRLQGEHFIDTVNRLGADPFKEAANAARHPADDESLSTLA
jgi:sulfite reductase (NADPH) hemoprotein beta-component